MTQSEEISHDVRRFAAERGVFYGSNLDSRPVNAATAAPATKPNFITRLVALLYGIVSYILFAHTFLYAIGFVSGLVAPKTIDTGPVVPVVTALIVNLLLMSLFASQHSVMARRQFKQWWTRFVPKSVERSTYVLLASLTLILLFWQWRPMPGVVWHIDDPQIAMAVIGLSFLGWLIVLTSTFLINHFELFGLHQVANNLTGQPMPAPRFRTPFYYKLVRHPLYLGFIIAFWAAPTMTVGHLLFAAVTTAYILVGILLEEHDLVDLFGNDYRRYKQRVPMLVPWHLRPDQPLAKMIEGSPSTLVTAARDRSLLGS